MNRPNSDYNKLNLNSPKISKQVDQQVELYSIVNAIEHLERAYIRDCIPDLKYYELCSRLLDQCKTAFLLVKNKNITSIEKFLEVYKCECPLATNRINVNKPIEPKGRPQMQSKSVASIVALFITIIDKLRLDIRSIDQLSIDIKELYSILCQNSQHQSLNGTQTIHNWISVMSGMKASEELTDDQARQLIYDLENTFSEFNISLVDK